MQAEKEVSRKQHEQLERLEADHAILAAGHSAVLSTMVGAFVFCCSAKEMLTLGCVRQEEKHKEKLREHREAWESAKKELQGSHEIHIQTLEATYQNQVSFPDPAQN